MCQIVRLSTVNRTELQGSEGEFKELTDLLNPNPIACRWASPTDCLPGEGKEEVRGRVPGGVLGQRPKVLK